MLRFDDDDRRLRLGVHDLLALGPREGDLRLDVPWSSRARLTAGRETHQAYQRDQQPHYVAELTVRHRLSVRGWEVLLTGRMDGMIAEGETWFVEEIKSTTLPASRLKTVTPQAFPSALRQLQLYLHFMTAGSVGGSGAAVLRGRQGRGRLVLISLVDGTRHALHVDPDPNLPDWLETRLDEVVRQREDRLAWQASRRQVPVPFAHDS
ncbi:MAG: hypothetical protein QGG40_18765, partial [Myxococcota bacterium]|nr:hypothetical protein [Myxococcota bacterium]